MCRGCSNQDSESAKTSLLSCLHKNKETHESVSLYFCAALRHKNSRFAPQSKYPWGAPRTPCKARLCATFDSIRGGLCPLDLPLRKRTADPIENVYRQAEGYQLSVVLEHLFLQREDTGRERPRIHGVIRLPVDLHPAVHRVDETQQLRLGAQRPHRRTELRLAVV